MQLIEIHDQPWVPRFLRDQITDALQAIFDFADLYRPVVERLEIALQAAGATDVLDLCSGAGGPWPGLIEVLGREGGSAVEVWLTDKYPHAAARAGAGSQDRIHFFPDPLDATKIPAQLPGFRTIFNSFHHFPPRQARAILQDAVNQQRGIGVFEVPARRPGTILLVFLVPLADWILTPFLRPFCWSRLLFTYLIPLIPLVLWFDGIVSCLRAYSLDELGELTDGLSANQYQWESGEEKSGLLPITYLIGRPGPAAPGGISAS